MADHVLVDVTWTSTLRWMLAGMQLNRLLQWLPLALTLLRALLAPIVLLLAFYYPVRTAFGWCLATAFLSDWMDGVIARRLGVATTFLRRLDSIADTLFYLCAAVAVWHLSPLILLSRKWLLLILVVLELSRYLFDAIKFRQEASYHMWSSKLWGVLLFFGFFPVLVWGHDTGLFTVAICVGIVADAEGLAISWILPAARCDVPSVFHAIRIAANS